MRLDRLITLALAEPTRRAAQRLHSPAPPSSLPPYQDRLPILMYHSISDDSEGNVHPYFKVCTSPHRFAEQMQWLADDGWKGVTLSEGLEALSAQRSVKSEQTPKADGLPLTADRCDAKLVAITFDDGFRDFHTAAWPILQRHGFSATMYLPTAFIGDTRRSFKGRECLTWTEVRELRAAGAEFGSHTVNHPRLVQLQWPAIEAELRDSHAELTQRLGEPAPHFAYPYGFPQAEPEFENRFRELLRAAGYATNVTTIIGQARASDDAFRLPRLPANSDDDRILFEAKLAGSYDWLATSQAITKHAARWLRPASRPVAGRGKG